MPRKPLLFDISNIDLNDTYWTKDQIQKVNPQRYEFDMVDKVVYADAPNRNGLAYKDLTPDDWWCRGHVPGRPLLPGVLMIEAAAQLSSCMVHIVMPGIGFVGFAGVDEVKFRGQVVPPGRLLLLIHATNLSSRRVIAKTQAVYNDELVFEATVTGMPI